MKLGKTYIKHLLTVFCLLLGQLHVWALSFNVPETKIEKDAEIEFSVELDNPDTEVIALDIWFSTDFEKDHEKEHFIFEKTDRLSNHVLDSDIIWGDSKIVIYSPSNEPIKGNSGTIFTCKYTFL